jgi:homospermidine synthase
VLDDFHPCDDAVLSLRELAGMNWQLHGRQKLLRRMAASGTRAVGMR